MFGTTITTFWKTPRIPPLVIPFLLGHVCSTFSVNTVVEFKGKLAALVVFRHKCTRFWWANKFVHFRLKSTNCHFQLIGDVVLHIGQLITTVTLTSSKDSHIGYSFFQTDRVEIWWATVIIILTAWFFFIYSYMELHLRALCTRAPLLSCTERCHVLRGWMWHHCHQCVPI